MSANSAIDEFANTAPLPATSTPASRTRSGRNVFDAVVEPLMPELLRYFARRVLPVADSADCLSETLLALWKHRTRLPDSPDEQRAWAYGIARRVLANHQRKRIRRHKIDDRVRTLLAEQPTELSDVAATALEALSRLSAKNQELIRLIIWDGFGVAEAGAVLGMKPATARSRYARAKAQLREHILLVTQ